jgi:polyisoprenyl-teichoic acid--peptidoglycan teichoic acid transferase
MRKRAVFAVAALSLWVAGAAIGVAGPSSGGIAIAQTAGIILGKAHTGYTPPLTGKQPIVILAIGSGARPGDDVLHSLSDSIHIIEIDPKNHHAVIIGVPRDSWVSIPGHGTNKINAAMGYGGPALLIQTLEQISGLHIDYYALTTFWGISSMIDQIGGLTVDVPFSMHDSYSGANFSPGVHHLDGKQVLAFSRDRHSLLSGDFGRSEDGGRVFLAALAQYRKEFAQDPSRMFSWISAGMRNLSTDLPLTNILQLAYFSTKIPLKNVQNMVLPGTTGMEGALSVVHINTAQAKVIFNDAKPDAIVSKNHVPPSPTAGQ